MLVLLNCFDSVKMMEQRGPSSIKNTHPNRKAGVWLLTEAFFFCLKVKCQRPSSGVSEMLAVWDPSVQGLEQKKGHALITTTQA